MDGNGRLLITLLVWSEKTLNEPILYLILYFKTRQSRYRVPLNEVSQTGDWKVWLDFFADAPIHASSQAVETARKLVKLSNDDDSRIRTLRGSRATRASFAKH